VLVDFFNTTGDPVFDDTLQQALNVSLSQSPFLNVLSEAKVAATLRMMEHQRASSSRPISLVNFASEREARLTFEAPSPAWAVSMWWG